MMCKNCKHTFCWYCLQNLDVSAAEKDSYVRVTGLGLVWGPVQALHQLVDILVYVLAQFSF